MLVALAVNAATTEVAPGVKTLETAVAAASAGDVLVLGDGTFYEEGNFDIKKNLTIKAADGAKPVIANRWYLRVEGGADVTFQGIKFDGAAWRSGNDDPLGASDHCVRSYKASTGEEDITFEDCEFTGYPGYILYTQRADRKWNSITLIGCFFHNNVKSAVYITNESGTEQSCNALTIKNSTFVNFTGSYDIIYYNAPADNHTTPLIADHCTFYGHPKRAIYWQVSENLTVSNCIFAQPAEVTYKSVECVSGTISNCLSYNSAGYSSAATSTNNIVADPKFVNAAEGNFNLADDSPALTLNDGEPIGDPRWVPAPAHTYSVVGPLSPAGWDEKSTAGDMTLKDGVYSFKVENVELVAGTPYEYKIVEDHAWTVAYPQNGNATFTVDKSGKYDVTFTLNASSKEYAAVPELIEEIVVVPTVAMHGNFLGNWADTENFTVADDKKTASIKLTIEAGNYEFGMRIGSSSNWTSNGVAFSRENNSAKIVAGQGNLTLAADAAGDYIFTWTYETETLAITFPEAEPEPELPYMAIIGDMNDWAGTELVPAEDKLTASATIHLDMNANSGYGFKVLIGDKAYCIEPSGEWYSFHRGWTSASGIDHVATDEEAFWLSIDKAGDYTFTWTIAEKKLDITFPELLNITYYFVNTPDWEKVYAYAWSPAIADWPGEEATLQLGVSKNGHNVWAYTMPENRRNIVFNDGTGGEGHQTDDLTVEDGKPYFNDGTWYATLDDVPTAIENTVVGAKVQKLIENGQIVIIRNGEKFNAQGQVIR